MAKKVSEVIQYFENLYSGKAVYLWGSNGQIITPELCASLYKKYGNKTYDQDYYNKKLLEGAGRIGADCSGAFYPVSGRDRTAQGYYDDCSVKGDITYINKDVPCLVFKGVNTSSINHIGFYCGNGYVIEMKSSKENCTKTKLESGSWKFYGIPSWIDYGNTIALGVDLSEYQTSVDFKKLKEQGYQFVILRTITKSGSVDKKYKEYYPAAKQAGLKVGVYILSYALSEVEAITSAQSVIALLGKDKVPIFLDLESDGKQFEKIGKAGITRIAKAFIQTCNQYGYPCYIYCNTDWYKNIIDKSLQDKAIWIARYGKNNGLYEIQYKPNIGEKIWQYTSHGQINGIKGGKNNYVDVNACYDMSIFGGSTGVVIKPTPSYKVEKINVMGLVTATDFLNIRKEPDVDSQVVGKYNSRQIISLTGKVNNGWYKTKDGYISGNYVRYLQGKVVNCNKVHVRQMPDKTSVSLGHQVAGDLVLIIVGLGEWFNVITKDNLIGWIKKDYLELQTEL